MTPKQEMICFGINDSITEIKDKISSSDRATFLVYKDKPENIIGAATVNDILVHFIGGDCKSLDLEKNIQSIANLSADLPALVAIERLKNLSIDMALIKDSNSEEVVGFISFHDILEAIVGSFKRNE